MLATFRDVLLPSSGKDCEVKTRIFVRRAMEDQAREKTERFSMLNIEKIARSDLL